MKIRHALIILLCTFTPLVMHAQNGGCNDPRSQVCNPGQYADTSGDQTACRACTGNTVANGCTRSCTSCGPGTKPNRNHSACVGGGGSSDPRSQVCNPGQYADTSGDQTACLPCKGNTVGDGTSRSCSPCSAGTIPNINHSSCGGLHGHANYFIHSNCKAITGLTVTIDVTEDMIFGSTIQAAQGQGKGFAFQLNAYSQEGASITTGWQQYILHVNTSDRQETKFNGQVNNWPYPGIHSLLVQLSVPVISLPISGAPAHYKFTISLATDGGSNVSGVTFTIIDPHGKRHEGTITLVKQPPNRLAPSLPASLQGPLTQANLAPIVGFQLDIVGPDGSRVLLSRGAGSITYTASSSSPLTAADSPLSCFRFVGTGEDSNTNYSTVSPGSAPTLTQKFSVPK